MKKLALRKVAVVCSISILLSTGCTSPINKELNTEMQRANKSENKMLLGGVVGDRFDANIEQWLLVAPYANPAMFEMFHQRDNEPQQRIVAWYGEFPGKYLTSAVLSYAMSGDESLKNVIKYTVNQLIGVQDEDGYLGVFSKGNRLAGKVHPSRGNDTHWDLWNHYHCMLGLYLWYKQSGDENAFEACKKAADYIYDFLIKGNRKIEDSGSTEMNMSICHIYTLLYEETNDPRYLEMTEYIFKAFETEGCGDFINASLSGVEFYKMEKPRWESLHCIQAIYEMYKITGDEKYRKAFENIWWSILKTDRHNTGGFSSGEQAQGNPYDLRAIETCCTVAWTALSVDMLKLTDNSYVADEIELSLLNGILGAQHPSGRYFVYNAPMIGVKRASADEIGWQAHPGSPELNCCSVNGPRGIGMISDWGIIVDQSQVTVNYYGASETTRILENGERMTIIQNTEYPKYGKIKLKFQMDKPTHLKLRLRIPFWSQNTKVYFNGDELSAPQPMSYYCIEHTFKDGDEIDLNLDMSLHYWAGDFELGGRVSLYRGPVLLAYDQRWNPKDYNQPPTLSIYNMDYELVDDNNYPAPWVLCKFRDIDGNDVYLCDYATAGATGAGFTTWLPFISSFTSPKFSYTKPVWGQR